MTTKIETEEHVKFWKYLALTLDAGVPALRALRETGAKLGPGALTDAAGSVADAIEQGQVLSEALASQPEAFSPTVVTILRAGEAGGVVDVVCTRIVEGLENGAFPVPGAEADPDGDMVRFWRSLTLLLMSGVPVLEALATVRGDLSSEPLVRAVGAIHASVQEGRSLSDAMRAHPDLFPQSICDAIAKGERDASVPMQMQAVAASLANGDVSDLADEGGGASSDDIVRVTDKMIRDAFLARASDIHVDPLDGDAGYVRFRIDGVLHRYEDIEPSDVRSAINRLKVMAKMDIAETRLPQDGRFVFDVEGRRLDLRTSCVPSIHGERMVLRILDRAGALIGLERVVHDPDDLARVRELGQRPSGIVLCNGPTGSGKTTLLYSLLREVDRESCNVIAVEDPVEYIIEGTAQIPIRPAIGMGFKHIVRAILRQDPDVIMVGELRDLDTMQICVQAALTGHLVLSSLHANTSVAALQRLVDVGLEKFLINSSLAGIISQRLVRRLCDKCKEPVEPPALELLSPEARRMVQTCGVQAFHTAKGCPECGGRGYRGRVAVHEVLVMDDGVRQALASPDYSPSSLQAAARKGGMRTLLECGMAMAAEGITSFDEVLRVVPMHADR